MLRRSIAIAVLIVAAGAYARGAASSEPDVARVPLAGLPSHLGEWRGVDAEPFPDDVINQLGVDEYVNRRYSAGLVPISVYIGYYASQRQGDTIHSPQNCLPGAGWHPTESGRETLRAPDGAVTVNRYVISKGLDRQVVFYWYQGRGRIVASEYANKALLMLDAARLGRTNGALVRLITPVVSTPEAAGAELRTFASALLAHLPPHLP